jgi:hypothetical protein
MEIPLAPVAESAHVARGAYTKRRVVWCPLQVPGDGRELVVMLPDAVKVSAEDGRRVEVRHSDEQLRLTATLCVADLYTVHRHRAVLQALCQTAAEKRRRWDMPYWLCALCH